MDVPGSWLLLWAVGWLLSGGPEVHWCWDMRSRSVDRLKEHQPTPSEWSAPCKSKARPHVCTLRKTQCWSECQQDLHRWSRDWKQEQTDGETAPSRCFFALRKHERTFHLLTGGRLIISLFRSDSCIEQHKNLRTESYAGIKTGFSLLT